AQIEGAQNCVSAAALTDDEYESALQRYTVFGRVTPDQKQKFVTALQKQGEVVAMTGDGVNDILAMKRADTSIA
ncbi:HAD family hydrolase, partial [Agathobacter rectalis]